MLVVLGLQIAFGSTSARELVVERAAKIRKKFG
jgi:hypothetical protein